MNCISNVAAAGSVSRTVKHLVQMYDRGNSRFVHLLAVAVVLVFLSSCVQRDQAWNQQNQKLSALTRSKATKDLIEAQLGRCQFYYELGSSNWSDLDTFLTRDRRTDIREKMGDSTNVMYYTSQSMMTWVFLDSEKRIKDYYLCGQ
jgi:hypothetical protein